MRLPTTTVQLLFLATLVVGLTGCSTLQPPDPNGPRNESTYPPLYTTDDVRRNAVDSTLNRFILPPNTQTDPELDPITLTLKNLGLSRAATLFLPKLGTAAVMTEEETRESLRRFIREWQDLIGSDPGKLSLVARVDQPDGIKLATYEQRPFRYPIRGDFGKLEIRFTNERRVVSMSSTCVPNADRVQAALSAVSPKLKPEDAIAQLINNPIGASGAQSAFSVQASQATPRELVTYVRPSASNAEALEFHLAWELEVRNAPVQRVYVDALNGEIIAAR
ncbi:MAG TPA: hypothetical protein VJU86_10785 [Pyrinomonadaceae bacterium]|nr:hypothetical protein [Pyrinomonadaceae bacterium]